MPQPQQGRSTHAHRCFPRFSRVLSCTHHVHHELHSAAAQSSNAHSFREARTSVACDGSIATDIGGRQVPQQQQGRSIHTLTAACHASAVCSAAPSTCFLSCTARLHSLATLTASERRSQASHAMAQSQLTIGGAVHAAVVTGSLSHGRSPLPLTLQPWAQLQSARPF